MAWQPASHLNPHHTTWSRRSCEQRGGKACFNIKILLFLYHYQHKNKVTHLNHPHFQGLMMEHRRTFRHGPR